MKLTSPSSKAIFVVAALLLFASSSALEQTQEPAKPATTPPAETTPAEPARSQDNAKGESRQTWSPLMDIDNSNGQSANAYHRGHYALTNLLFYPTDNVMIGGELQWGRHERTSSMASSLTISASSFRLDTTSRRHSPIDL